MYFFEGKTQKEIAEELNVTVNKVKNWRKGALKKLKKYAVKAREEQ
jgi:DNA-directed RNA polymerase